MYKWLRVAGCMLLFPGAAIAQHNHVQIARQNMPAVVTVNVLQKDGSAFSGTGFVLTDNGVIATANHVLDNSIYTQIAFPNGVLSGEAIPLARHPQQDVALLKIDARFLPTVTLAEPDEPVLPGQTITVIGNPRRLQNTVTSGLISQVRSRPDGTTWLQISAPISPRSSGSPVFNEHGRVIGMAVSSVQGEGNQNLNFAAPVEAVKTLLTQEGISLPGADAKPHENAFIRHVKKSWEIAKRLLRSWKQHWLENSTSNS